MPLNGEYLPSPRDFPREQVEEYEGSGGTAGLTRNGYPVVIVTSRGAKTGALRKTPLIRVEFDGQYAAVASIGGAPTNPAWYYNLTAHPLVEVQDGSVKGDYLARELADDELAAWWVRSIETFPPYAEYRATSAREIPIFLLTPVKGEETSVGRI